MARWKRYIEIYAVCSIFPIAAGTCAYFLWKAMLWSYGGRGEFKKMVLVEPARDKWYETNPRQVFFREDAPLSGIPKHITEKPAGDPTAVSDERKEW